MHSGRISARPAQDLSAFFARSRRRVWRLISLFVCCLLIASGDGWFAAAKTASVTIENPPLAPALDVGDSAAGMPVGSMVRVKCTEPAVELNNAKLLEVTGTTLTLISATGERYRLPRNTTTLLPPVNWKRTATVPNDLSRPARTGNWSRILIPALVLIIGIAGWLGLVRRRQAKPEAAVVGGTKGQASPLLKEKATPALLGYSKRGRVNMAMTAGPAAAAPAETPEPPSRPAPEPERIEELIESRRYGTAIERLEQQCRVFPDEFPIRLQLLEVYKAIGNRKQAERIAHQIEFHPGFSPEQKLKAREAFPLSEPSNGAEPKEKAARTAEQASLAAAREKAAATAKERAAIAIQEAMAAREKELAAAKRGAAPAAKPAQPARS